MPAKYPTINTFIDNHKTCLICGDRTFLSIGSAPTKFDGHNLIRKEDGLYSAHTAERMVPFQSSFTLKKEHRILKVFCVSPHCRSGVSADIKTGSIKKIYYWLDLGMQDEDLIFAGGTNEECDLISKHSDVKAIKIGKVKYKEVLDINNLIQILKTYSLFS
jgi:hypothetical protein